MTGDRVRDEAERLVAAAIAAVSLAARGMGTAGRGASFATGSPECCVCPVCRVIAAMRDPSSDLAERLASGAGDLATGVASMMRALSRASGHGGADEPEPTREGDEFWEELRRRASAEARASASDHSGQSSSTVDDPWHVATTAPSPASKVVKKAVKKAPPPAKAPPPTKPASTEKTVSPAKAAPVKKVAKKATKKATPPEATE
jgi:hypothetical protein